MGAGIVTFAAGFATGVMSEAALLAFACFIAIRALARSL